MTVVSEQGSRGHHAGGSKIYTVGRVASGAIAASVIGVLGQHFDNLTPPPYTITSNMALALPNLLPCRHRVTR
jgi:hypothetical protein